MSDFVTSVKRKELIESLDVVRDGLSKLDWMEQSDHFIFSDGLVMTFNDEIFVSARLNGFENFKCSVPGEEFYSLLSKLDSELVKLRLHDNKLFIHSKNSKASLVYNPNVNIPIPDFLESDQWNWTKLPSNFVSAIDFSSGACATEVSIPILTCVNVTSNFCEATDRYRIARVKFSEKLSLDDFLIPVKNIKVILKLNPVEVYLTKDWVHFRNEQGTIASSRIFVEKFVNLDQFISVDGMKVSFPVEISDVIDRAYVFAKRDHFLDEQIEVTITKDSIYVEASSDVGWFREKVKVSNNIENSISFLVSPVILRSIFDNFSKDLTAEISDKFVKFVKNEYLYLGVLRKVGEEEE